MQCMIYSNLVKCKLCFKYGNETISVVEDYVYLGVKFSYNAKFIKSYNNFFYINQLYKSKQNTVCHVEKSETTKFTLRFNITVI